MRSMRRKTQNDRPKPERIQKLLANIGIASRRKIEEMITEGRININGEPAKLGDLATERDLIKLNGRKIIFKKNFNSSQTRVLIYNKPLGEICTRAKDEKRPNVFRNLPKIPGARWISIGRLDINSTGLLLFTNDGQLANKMMHPSSNIEREYLVRILGALSPEQEQKLLKGVEIDGHIGKFEKIIRKPEKEDSVNTWLHVILKEGKNREVRKLFETQGLTVNRLKRVRFGNFTLPRFLRPGKFKEINKYEIDKIF